MGIKPSIIDPEHIGISITRQCELLSLPREPDAYNDLLMRLIDEQYTKTPFYGVPRIAEWFKRQCHHVNHKRVARLMGLEGIHPKRNLSQQAN